MTMPHTLTCCLLCEYVGVFEVRVNGQVTHHRGVRCTQSLTPIPHSVLWIYMGQWNFDNRFYSHQT